MALYSLIVHGSLKKTQKTKQKKQMADIVKLTIGSQVWLVHTDAFLSPGSKELNDLSSLA